MIYPPSAGDTKAYADDLVLMTAARAEQEGELTDLTVRLLAEMAKSDRRLVSAALPRVLPWIRFLPAGAIDEFIAEFIETTAAASSVGNMASVSQLLAAWRHTAEIYSDPELYSILRAPSSGDFGPVPAPEIR